MLVLFHLVSLYHFTKLHPYSNYLPLVPELTMDCGTCADQDQEDRERSARRRHHPSGLYPPLLSGKVLQTSVGWNESNPVTPPTADSFPTCGFSLIKTVLFPQKRVCGRLLTPWTHPTDCVCAMRKKNIAWQNYLQCEAHLDDVSTLIRFLSK